MQDEIEAGLVVSTDTGNPRLILENVYPFLPDEMQLRITEFFHEHLSEDSLEYRIEIESLRLEAFEILDDLAPEGCSFGEDPDEDYRYGFFTDICS